MQEYWAYDFERGAVKDLVTAEPAKETNIYPMFVSPSTGRWVSVDSANNVMVMKEDKWRFIYPGTDEHQTCLDEFAQQGLKPFAPAV